MRVARGRSPVRRYRGRGRRAAASVDRQEVFGVPTETECRVDVDRALAVGTDALDGRTEKVDGALEHDGHVAEFRRRCHIGTGGLIRTIDGFALAVHHVSSGILLGPLTVCGVLVGWTVVCLVPACRSSRYRARRHGGGYGRRRMPRGLCPSPKRPDAGEVRQGLRSVPGAGEVRQGRHIGQRPRGTRRAARAVVTRCRVVLRLSLPRSLLRARRGRSPMPSRPRSRGT